tara:strand:+ start:88 stop:261 length:174 start_codon:yes stop_codon:yes gene_type:complete
MNDKDRMEKLEKKVKTLESELESVYRDNLRLSKMYAAVRELQEMHDAPASTFIHYLV